MQPGAPLLYEEFGTNIAFICIRPDSTEIDKVFAQTQAEGGIIVKARLVNQRVAPASMETRGVVAEYRKADQSPDALEFLADPTPATQYPGRPVGPPTAPGARDCSRSWWWLRL